MGPAVSRKISRARATQDTTRLRQAVVYGVSPSMTALSKAFHLPSFLPRRGPTTPVSPRRHGFGLFRVRSPLLTESLFIFLLLWVPRCFSSPRSPPLRDGRPSTCRVAPFGYPGSTAICASPGCSYHVLRRLRAKGIHRLPLLTFSHLVHTYGLIYLQLALLVSSF